MIVAHLLFTYLVALQVYYLYRFIYSIPLQYKIKEPENEYRDVKQKLRGSNASSASTSSRFSKCPSSHEMHKQIRRLRLPLEQTRNDNNTALIYTPVTTPDVVGQF